MAETAGVGVAIVVGEIRIVLGAMVVGQLQNAGDRFHPLGARGGIGRDLVFVDQCQEIQAELGFREVAFFHQGKTQNACVEVQGLGDVLDPQHGVVEDKFLRGGVRLGGDAGEGVQFVQAHGPSGKYVG
ncbi:hypothetical protein D3C81_611160 [compost metagenome]